MRRRCRLSVAGPLVCEHITKVAHINSAIAVGALNEMLPLVLRLTATILVDDPAGMASER